jgi:hypothetical protein
LQFVVEFATNRVPTLVFQRRVQRHPEAHLRYMWLILVASSGLAFRRPASVCHNRCTKRFGAPIGLIWVSESSLRR